MVGVVKRADINTMSSQEEKKNFTKQSNCKVKIWDPGLKKEIQSVSESFIQWCNLTKTV